MRQSRDLLRQIGLGRHPCTLDEYRDDPHAVEEGLGDLPVNPVDRVLWSSRVPLKLMNTFGMIPP